MAQYFKPYAALGPPLTELRHTSENLGRLVGIRRWES
jgi:hypothetical protein